MRKREERENETGRKNFPAGAWPDCMRQTFRRTEFAPARKASAHHWQKKGYRHEAVSHAMATVERLMTPGRVADDEDANR